MDQEKPELDLGKPMSFIKDAKSSNSNSLLRILVQGFKISEAIHVAVQLNLAELLKDQGHTVKELAETTGTNLSALHRLLRMLVAVDLLTETPPNYFSLTSMGQLLQKGVPGSVYTSTLFFGSPRVRNIWPDLLYSVQTGETATDHVLGMPTWQYYVQHSEEAPIFYNFMSESSNQVASSVAESYDFTKVKALADVGGGRGNILATILRKNPTLLGILFDLPSVAREAKENLEGNGVFERCQIIGGDIFKPWPFNADLYLLSRIIHDWDDEQAIDILKNCRAAMTENSKVVLVEQIVPEDKETALLFYMSDLQMLVGTGGKERTIEEYQYLFQQAGLNFSRTIPLYSPYALIEAEPI